MRIVRCLIVAIVMAWLPLASAGAAEATGTPDQNMAGPDRPLEDDTYSQNEILHKAQSFFGATTEGLAEAIEKLFAEQGRPNAYILGQEGGGAFFVGVRYGKGTLNRKGEPTRTVYWQGPTAGFDFGGNGSKVFTLIYHLNQTDDLYQRFPGVGGSLYVVAGLGINYNRSGGITLAPIRTGVGLRYGVNVGYIVFTRDATVNPF